MKNSAIQFSVALCLCFLLSCGTTRIYYLKNKTVNSALMSNRQPFRANVLNEPAIQMGNWRLDALSVSPDGRYLALGSSQIKSPLNDSKSKLEIYDVNLKQMKYTFYTNDLKQKFRINNDTDYGSIFYMLHPYKLGFRDGKTLVIQVQPYADAESIPMDALLEIDVVSGAALSAKLVDRGDFTVINSLPSKTNNTFEIRDGKMFVDGNQLTDMPTGLSSPHDEVKIGN
ncbi:hypothetical protein BXY82_2387 [Gelidibacter sediminis]|uniref:Uncharacterized protein n=1 Tax=Gelidibacter sediminis TaxID=1608710 RepID=A0A4R7Q1K4_9FLAO|nr:hypothetical protein [Gelidibacter sediminis]TDU40340.1 hypothetical protein BXY82_2387 [Gelidibacter sediminis]